MKLPSTTALTAVLVLLGTASAQTTLTQWYHEYGETGTKEAIQRYARDYEKTTPNVKLDVTMVTGDIFQKLNPALLAGTAPDVFETNAQYIYQQAKAGQLAPLDDIVSAAVRRDFNADLLKAYTYNGKLYAIPTLIDPMLLFYRKSALSKAGLKTPQTFDDLVNVVDKLNTPTTKGLFLGNDGGAGHAVFTMTYSSGNKLINGTTVATNTATQARALDAFRKLARSKGLLVGAPTDWWDPSAISQNLAAIQYSGLWALPGMQQAAGNDIGAMPWPKYGANGRPFVALGGWAVAVNAKSKNVAAAKALVKSQWIDNAALQEDWNTAYGFHIPARNSVAAASEKLKTGTAADVVRLASTYGRSLYPGLWSGDVELALRDGVTRIMRTDASAVDLLRASTQNAQTALNRLVK
ncbi:ABC transporter substrate-binding protein [Deinococcus pimensis]|uniref:ABC transporter substrate-binding protein n=1 Tax=Deinococcus pimensis TaxID=309888 RepID=UPI0004B0EC0F|nr:extracellular solute-binding protein [Deinococcus pimensis]